MKKYIGLSLLLLAGTAFVPSAEAKPNTSGTTISEAANNMVEPQYQRRVRTTRTYTRNVRRGRFLYRETYRTTYRPNGRVVTRLISRVVIRRY